MEYVLDLFLHLDVHLAEFVAQYGIWVYAGLFAVIFAETGLVVTPFLPGDSLLFAAGALAATGAMDITLVLSLIAVAAILGNTVNYAIGRAIGPRVFTASDDGGLMQKLLNRKHLDKAHAFFEQHGGLAVVSSRFAPIIRTFVPFVAGVASMKVSTFVIYNIAGGLLWTAVCVGAGYAFGNVPIIKENFSLVALGIVGLSMIPIFLEIIKHRRSA